MQDHDIEDDWVAIRVAAAAASVDDELSAATLELLKNEMYSTMGERPLRQSELTNLATRLLESTVPKDDLETEA